MELSFSLQNNDEKKLLEFKKELEKQLGKQNVELGIAPPQPGQMGIAVTDVVKAAFDKEHVNKIKEFIAKFVKHNKIEMSLENAKGEKIKLTAAMEKEILYMLLNGFFERTLIDEQAINKQKDTKPAKDNNKPRKTTKKNNNKHRKTSNKTSKSRKISKKTKVSSSSRVSKISKN